jgi:hypothetical protein
MNPSSRTQAIQLPRDQTTVLVVTGLAGFVAPFTGWSIDAALSLIGLRFQASAVTLELDLLDLHPSSGGRPHVGRAACRPPRPQRFVWGMLTFALGDLPRLGFAFFASLMTQSVMDSDERSHSGVVSATLRTMRLAG